MIKRVFFIFALFLILGCSTDQENSTGNPLFGTWNWIRSSGGITGRTDTPESTGNMMTLEVSDSMIKRYENGTLVSERSYSIASGESLIFGELREMIIYDDDFKQTFVLDQNTLSLYDECNDCFVSIYERE